MRDGPAPRLARAGAFRQGLLSDLSNPKMAAFFTSLLPQFGTTAAGPSFWLMLGFGLLFCALTWLWLALYAVALERVGETLRRPRGPARHRGGDRRACSSRSACGWRPSRVRADGVAARLPATRRARRLASRAMLREVKDAAFGRRLTALGWRYHATWDETPVWTSRRFRALQARQGDEPVALHDTGRRRYWLFEDRVYWEDDGLAAADVLALVREREHRTRRRLERAHAIAAQRSGGAVRRAPAPDPARAADRGLAARRRRVRGVRLALRPPVRPRHPARARRREHAREPPGPVRAVQPAQGRERGVSAPRARRRAGRSTASRLIDCRAEVLEQELEVEGVRGRGLEAVSRIEAPCLVVDCVDQENANGESVGGA